MIVECSGEQLILCKEKAIYWEKEKMLIISDLHIGKSAHFRQSGIQVPGTVGRTDLQKLSALIEEYHPMILLVTGDMFHNKINSDAVDFQEWRKIHSNLKVLLIKGNHDDLRSEEYERLGITVFKKELIVKPFRFIHDKPKEFDEYYNISGHIHPGVVIYGRARQQLKFPCFYFSDTCAVLPAFSVFTGLFMIKPEPGDRFYAITPGKVVQV